MSALTDIWNTIHGIITSADVITLVIMAVIAIALAFFSEGLGSLVSVTLGALVVFALATFARAAMGSKDIAGLMLSQGAAFQVADSHDLAAVLHRLLRDDEERRRIGSIGRHIVESNRGSLARLLELIEPLLADPGSAPAVAAACPSTGC